MSSSTSSLSAPGAASYSTNTLHVGDGTWDNGRDTFLLPNLMGLNFATMQYNGMGNRFRNLPQYHRLVIGHGVVAAITFLAIVPSAIFVAKFYRTQPRRAIKMHVYLQILTVFLSTVVLVLGWFAVGPERSLTNPHHGIGVAIYVCVLVQFLYGWIMAKIERRRKNPAAVTRLPTKVWSHKLFGRAVALLGIVQIALGLTLYGSPKYLFILYALACFLLLVAYLALDRYYFEKRPVEWGLPGQQQPEFYSDYGSYLSGSRADYRPGPPPGQRREESRERSSHWGRNLLAGAGALGAYEAWKHRRSERRERREQEELDMERRQRPPPSTTAPTGTSMSRPSSRPPPGVVYGAGGVPAAGALGPPPRAGSRTPSRVRRHEMEESRLSPESWEDEKYSERPERHTWRDRLLGAGVGIGAFEGARRLFSRRKKNEDDYVEDTDDRRRYRPPLGGNQNMVSQTDVSRVEQGHAPISPPTNQRVNMGGVAPMTPTATPSRAPRRPGRRPSADSLSYDDEESIMEARHDDDRPQHLADDGPPQPESHTLRNSIGTLGVIGGFREWNKHRRERKEQQRADRIRREELDEEMFNRRTSGNYPQAEHAQGGRRPSVSGTLMTGTSVAPDPGFVGSNPELSRTRLDTHQPPLPATAGAVPMSASGAPPSTVGPSISQQRVHETTQLPAGYQLPPPPPGPPPGGIRRDYVRPEPGSLQMPQGAVQPDPNRLISREDVSSSQQQAGSSTHPGRDPAAGALAGAAAANMMRRNSQSESPSRRFESRQDSRTRLQRPLHRRGSSASGSVSQMNTSIPPASGDANPNSPPVSVKVKMHNDGRHVTLRRLNEEEAAAERAARRAERRQMRRRSSEVSSGGMESDGGGGNAPPGSNARYGRRNGTRQPGMIRRSSDQPITNIPPPPPMSSTAGSHRPPSELNLPTPVAGPTPAVAAGGGGVPPPPRVPQHSASPQDGEGLSPPAAPYIGSGMSGSPGDAGTGTDVSAFDNNRRRRRAERARRLEAARGGANRGGSVDFT